MKTNGTKILAARAGSQSGAKARTTVRAEQRVIFGEMAALLLITLLAATFRFYRLTEIPPGLHYDEAFKATTARALLNGAPPQLFFKSNMGEEPLGIYLTVAALGLVGQEPWVVHLPAAIVGALTVPLVWWLGRELFSPPRLRGQAVGLLSALVLAILYWHISFSRLGMEPILTPFFATLALAALARGLKGGGKAGPRTASFALSGLALGGSLYTYKAGYFIPLLAALFVAYAALVERGFLRRHGRGLLLAACVALLVIAPLALYFVAHPDDFWHRPTSVVLTEGTPESPGQAIIGNLPAVLGMFFVRGDANPRSNLPGRPALDPFLALLFLIGLVGAAAGFRRPQRALPVLWLGVMILPTLLTDYAPHFGRAIGATPAVALLCAGGAWGLASWLLTRLQARVRYPASVAVVLLLLLGGGLAFSAVSSARAYFGRWGPSPDLFYAYDVGLVQISEQINTLPADEDVYLTPTAAEHYTLQFLIQRPFSSFDGRQGQVFPPPDRAATVIVLLQEDEATLPRLQRSRPDGAVTWTLADDDSRPYAAAYYLPARDDPAPRPDHSVDAVLGDQIRLLGYDLTPLADRAWGLTLYWQALAPLQGDYSIFTHLLGDHNPATGGPLWAGHDSQPDGGRYPTSAWQPGQTILDVHPLTLPADAPPGEYRLETGLYLLATMERLSAMDAAGQLWPDNAILLGTVEIK